MAELLHRFPKFCTCWAFLEVVLFAGIIYGWGSLVFVLKEEGFYSDVCIDDKNDVIDNGLTSRKIHVDLLNASNDDVIFPRNTTDDVNGIERLACDEQESRLNLWFSIAVSTMYLSFTVIGYIIRSFGTRMTRIAFMIVYLTGVMCLAFATPEFPWLLLPGLACVGTGGLVVLATNLQVADLHPHARSTIIAIFTGLFDLSSINKQFVRMAYDDGIPRRVSYIFIAIMFAIMVSCSTLFFLPKQRIEEAHVAEIKRRRSSVKVKVPVDEKDDEPEQYTGMLEKAKEVERNNEDDELAKQLGTTESLTNGKLELEITDIKSSTPGLLSSLLSVTCILHLIWLFIHALRYVTFIGLLNVWLDNLFDNDEEKVGDMLAVFSYMTFGALITALVCGLMYDSLRKRFTSAGDIKRVYIPVIPPMILVIGYSVGTTVSCLVEDELAPYFAFTFFTFFRSAVFTVAVAFIGDAFPLDHFGVLFGFLQCSAGMAGLMQYPVFQWFEAYEGSYMHVNICLLVLQLLTLIHPLILYIRGMRDISKPQHPHLNNELTIDVPGTA